MTGSVGSPGEARGVAIWVVSLMKKGMARIKESKLRKGVRATLGRGGDFWEGGGDEVGSLGRVGAQRGRKAMRLLSTWGWAETFMGVDFRGA